MHSNPTGKAPLHLRLKDQDMRSDKREIPLTVCYIPKKKVSHLRGDREKTGCVISITRSDLCGPHFYQGSSNLKSGTLVLGESSSCIIYPKNLKKTHILGYEQCKLQRKENQTKTYMKK